ncbi:MAG: hypothetical protein VX574_04850 [Myxococcota bacterium]|nr:hypothetical protein [Myxococcota bacterium]
MNARKIGCVAAAILLMGGIASTADADGRRRGEGILRSVDPSALTVQVNRTTLKLGPATEIRDPLGVRLALSEILDREGDPVRYRAGGGSPYPVLEWILVEDPEDSR